tara:strand:- start:119 stop:880 length:762 start_codon:yes stop_codon:yes gene_type:complete
MNTLLKELEKMNMYDLKWVYYFMFKKDTDKNKKEIILWLLKPFNNKTYKMNDNLPDNWEEISLDDINIQPIEIIGNIKSEDEDLNQVKPKTMIKSKKRKKSNKKKTEVKKKNEVKKKKTKKQLMIEQKEKYKRDYLEKKIKNKKQAEEARKSAKKSNRERSEVFEDLKNKQKMILHHKKTKMCKHGVKCKRKDTCHFAHSKSELKIVECKFGRNCKRIKCKYNHKDGRKIDEKPRLSSSKPGDKSNLLDFLKK